MKIIEIIIIVVSSLSIMYGCSNIDSNSIANNEKIEFDITKLNQQGLYGPADGLRSLSYEFCIPADEHFVSVIHNIDPEIKIYRHSPGRIACNQSEFLCVGDTYNKPYQKNFNDLANLFFIKRIIQSIFE
jgi:hypothetical protein